MELLKPRWPRRLGAIFALLAGLCAAGELRAQTTREYDLKAVFLYNFALFIEWPPEVFGENHAEFVIGVLGSDPFGEALDEVVTGETAKGRPFVIRRFRRPQDARDCQILFVSESETPRMPQIVAHFRGRPVLLVGDDANFTEAGGMIAFVTEENRVRLRVNSAAVQNSRLLISSKLLRLAEVVRAE